MAHGALLLGLLAACRGSWQPEVVELATDEPRRDDCGEQLVIEGDRLVHHGRELVRAYADEWLGEPRCDGARVLFLRGSSPEAADIYTLELPGGTPVARTHDHRASSATFTPEGLVFAADDQLYELGAGEPVRLGLEGRRPALTADGVLWFERATFAIDGVAGTHARVEHLRAAPGDVLLGERAGTLVALDVRSGAERVLGAGHRPFPSLDGATVYFRAAHDPAALQAVPVTGGAARTIATLPGRIVVGVDGPDGQHVMIDEPEHHLVSNRISPDGSLTDEGAHWVVPAPRGGWRFWQRPGRELELRVIAPGKPLGSMDCVITVASSINQWLDEHRLGYLAIVEGRAAWHILDVRTCTDERPHLVIRDAVGAGPDAVLSLDGTRWFSPRTPRVTRHLVRNFAARPR